MMEKDKLEIIARAICKNRLFFGADPDDVVYLSDGRQGKRWERSIPDAKAVMAALDLNSQTTSTAVPTGKRLITFLPDNLGRSPEPDVEEPEE
jgi:hypothetical protein